MKIQKPALCQKILKNQGLLNKSDETQIPSGDY